VYSIYLFKIILVLGFLYVISGCAQLITKSDFDGSGVLFDMTSARCDEQAKKYQTKYGYYNSAFSSCMIANGYTIK